MEWKHGLSDKEKSLGAENVILTVFWDMKVSIDIDAEKNTETEKVWGEQRKKEQRERHEDWLKSFFL